MEFYTSRFKRSYFEELLTKIKETKVMENKYFIPEISDLRVGYEGEYHNSSIDEAGVKELNYDRWEKTILDKHNIITMLTYGIKTFRVPYLTKEQIEAEGWSHINTNTVYTKELTDSYYYLDCFKKGNLTITFNNRIKSLIIKTDKDLTIYIGNCPSINEFKLIFKLLGKNFVAIKTIYNGK